MKQLESRDGDYCESNNSRDEFRLEGDLVSDYKSE